MGESANITPLYTGIIPDYKDSSYSLCKKLATHINTKYTNRPKPFRYTRLGYISN